MSGGCGLQNSTYRSWEDFAVNKHVLLANLYVIKFAVLKPLLEISMTIIHTLARSNLPRQNIVIGLIIFPGNGLTATVHKSTWESYNNSQSTQLSPDLPEPVT